MNQQTLRKLHGLNDLTRETIDAMVVAIAKTHRDIARRPYALLEQVDVIAVPVQAIEHVQQAVTDGVYQAIRAVNYTVGSVVAHVLDRLEE